MVIGIRMDEYREISGVWIGGTENSTYWIGVLNEIWNCGIKVIFIVSVDRLTGFTDAINPFIIMMTFSARSGLTEFEENCIRKLLVTGKLELYSRGS